MGCYIPCGDGQAFFKAAYLVNHHGALQVQEPESFEDIAPSKVVVCVIENGAFEAAGVCYDALELREFKYDGTRRARTWLLMDKAVVRDLVPLAYQEFLVDPVA